MHIRRRAGFVTTLIWVTAVAGCSSMPGASAPPSPSASVPTASATESPSPMSTVEATPTVSTTAEATPAASATGSPVAAIDARPSQMVDGPPPLGTLAANGLPAVAGQQGSWCYADQCVDIGGAPKRLLPMLTLAGPESRLTFAMPAYASFVHWSAWYAPSLQHRPIVLGQGGSVYDVDAPPITPYPPMNTATFAAPAGGDWVLTVELGFDGDAGGDASYYWRVVVP